VIEAIDVDQTVTVKASSWVKTCLPCIQLGSNAGFKKASV
jgi:hypothetical protein